ncbi:MAG: SpoVR family protein [Planctomycetota bacterium]
MPLEFPKELIKLKYKIRDIAASCGLDFYEVIFEVVDYDELNMIASYSGFPTRYPHWRFGMGYEELKKSYSYGLQKIYEMVINNNPCYAYLLSSNSYTDHKTVMAHVYGHCDFFKNNYWFSKTNRKMVDEMANHGTKIREYMETYGMDTVENFIDCCLSVENLIDAHMPFIIRKKKTDAHRVEETAKPTSMKFRSKEYMDSFINPKKYLREQETLSEELAKRQINFPESLEKDVLLFLIEHAPLSRWQRNILSIIREESYYFAPQRQTKIMNEGWATYWHSKMMTETLCSDTEIIDYADHHSGTLGSRPGAINPYKVGVELLRFIEDKWNKGKFGKEYEECESEEKRKKWNTSLGKGREKIFEVRKIHNDVTFIDEFFDQEFCDEQKLFTYGFDPESGQYVIVNKDYKNVKNKLLFMLSNLGQPIIYVKDGNYKNRGELLLVHEHYGVDLKIDYAKDTLKNLFTIWNRPVNLETAVGEKHTVFTYDGEKHSEEVVSESE